ncbi:AAA family ATPase [Leptospira meyeri]|uniref:AAA family ATPase n=1 Tax=Leptospira meyeri TaxID=29508 RepID=UPI0010841676|nr:AAA family ATPase [Leptospira meyeri]TGM60095.1 ATP-binding protein [Leptospira meyeri]
MKIRKITFENHPIFGNLNFDFTDKNGNTIETIIFAGENGVGKSLLLNTIFNFSNYNLENSKRDEKRMFELELSEEEVNKLKSSENHKHSFNRPLKNKIFQINFNFNIINSWNQISINAFASDNSIIEIDGTLFLQAGTRNMRKMLYSDTEINFSPKEIKTVTSKNIDIINTESEKSTSRLAEDITQLLIDIQSLDALEFNDWARKNTEKQIDETKLDVRIKRFTSAFDYMFPRKKYKRIDNVGNAKKIIFEEDGKEMDIDKLSSGEKQIVFRGSFLLKDKESSKGAIILIDEPEISLHPTWQLKVLSFYKKLFTNNSGKQTSQIFFSTHSPFIIHNANRNADKILILQKNSSGKLIISDEPKFYSWTPEKKVEEAFNIVQILDSRKTIIFVEGETDEKYFKECIEIYDHKNINFEFKWIGRINENGNAENTGDSALNQFKSFFLANMDIIPSKIILLYDNDTRKEKKNYGKLIVECMNHNPKNTQFKIGIENLLSIPLDFDLSPFYKQKIRIDDYGAESTIKELDKQKLSLAICNDLSLEIKKKILININSEILRLEL